MPTPLELKDQANRNPSFPRVAVAWNTCCVHADLQALLAYQQIPSC
jgi:hypothetical protein